jgi:hypothetical protein
MDSYISLVGSLLAIPFVYLLTRHILRWIFSFLPQKITVKLKTKNGNEYKRKVYVSKEDELLKSLDAVIAKAKAAKDLGASG